MRRINEVLELDFEHLGEWAEASSVWLEVKFKYKDNKYLARCLYHEPSCVLENVEIFDEYYDDIDYNDEVEDIADYLLSMVGYDTGLITKMYHTQV
jgi:hypothetical protein